jgi:AcrR family transcriptional regulator
MRGGSHRRPAGTAADQAEDRRAERRERFLEAGLELFGAGPVTGPPRSPMSVRSAGLSSRQFYEEFHTLEDLLAELHLP